jgi:hypothetical protein
MTPEEAINTGHLDAFVEFLAKHHRAPHQGKIDGGRRWGLFLMPPAELVDLARQYQDKFDIFTENISTAHGKAVRVLFFPKGRETGCLSLVGLALPTNLPAWLRRHSSIPKEGLRIERSPMDGHTVQIDFIGTFDRDAWRPHKATTSPDALSVVFRERLYMLGWNRQEIELRYFGTKSGEARAEPNVRRQRRGAALSPRGMALLEHLFECPTGATQIKGALGGVEATLAAEDSSRVFASELVDLLDQCKDAHLADAFKGLNMVTIPLNDNCTDYAQKVEQDSGVLVGPDPRMITLTFALSALAEAGRKMPADVLAEKVGRKFMQKCRIGSTKDKTNEWHIGRWGHVYYTAAAAIMMKPGVEQYRWGLPILDAVAAEYHYAEEPLYRRALAAYRYWRLKPQASNRIKMARQRLRSLISASRKAPIDPERVDEARRYLSEVGAQ